MKLRSALTLLLLLLAPVVLAGTKVKHDPTGNFDSYKTYAWGKGTDAARVQIQEWVVSTVEEQLAAKGLLKVPAEEADILVVTHAFGQMDLGVSANYTYVHSWDVGIISFNTRDITSGTVMVELIDQQRDEAVWRGMANGAIGDVNEAKLHKKVTKLLRKLFQNYPPS